jgi:hypothetical protein
MREAQRRKAAEQREAAQSGETPTLATKASPNAATKCMSSHHNDMFYILQVN